MMRLSEKIKKIRNDNKFTQEQFAEKMLVSRTAVSKWENDTCYPSIDSLKYMSEVFNISLDELIDFIDENKMIKFVAETSKYSISEYKFTIPDGSRLKEALNKANEQNESI